MSQWEVWLYVAALLVYAPSSSALEVNNGVCLYRKWERHGDIKFLVIAGIRESGKNGACGSTSRRIFEEIVAIEWIISLLRGNGSKADSFVPGLTIGYDLYDNCDSEDLTTDLLYSGALSEHTVNCSSVVPESSAYIGAISLTTPSATNIIARLLDPLPVFRPLMSSPVLNTHDHQNLLQSVVSFREEATAITKMLSINGWNFIIMVHTEDAVEEALEFKAMASSSGICINFTGAPEISTVTKIFTVMNLAYNKSIAVVYFGSSSGAENIVRLSKNSRPYGSKIHWVFTSKLANDSHVERQISPADSIVSVNLHALENMQFIAFFSNLLNVTLLQRLVQRYNFSQDQPEIHPYPVVDAIVSVINSVKEIWDTECDQQSSLGDCSTFETSVRSSIVQKIKSGVNVPDKFDNRYLPYFYNKTLRYLPDGTLEYDELHLNWHTTVEVSSLGTYTGKEFVAASTAQVLPASACRLHCVKCQAQFELRYSYLHGDFLILGLFSLRQYGNSPFACGHIRRGTNDIITVSSFIHSVKVRRNETGLNFGAIAIDDCYSELNTSHYLTELFSKRKIIKDPAHPDRNINFDNVISIVGALSSSVTLAIADLSTAIHLPVISYSASSPDLDNRNRYPYFLRTVPSDTLQVQGMVSVVLNLGVSHVGLVYIDDAYGQGGKLRLEQEASSRNICVEDPISVTQDMLNDYVEKKVIEKLYHQQVRVVLLFAIDSVAQQILDVMHAKFSKKYDPLIFISSEGWGSNRHLLNETSLGSLIFNIAAQAYNSEQYKTFLQSLRPFKENANRWIPRYFEDYNQCDLLTSFEKTFIENNEPKLCDKNFKTVFDVNTTKSLSEDQRYFHTMVSVFAITNGFQAFCKKESCRSDDLRNKLGRLFDFIKTSLYRNNRIFDEDGNGHIGYTIHNIQRDGLMIEYKQVGSYQNDGKLDLTQQPKFYDDLRQEISLQEKYSTEINCYNYIGTCSEVCPSHETTTPTTRISTEETTQGANEKDSSLMTMTILFGVFMAILLVALIFVVVILVRIQSRQNKQLSDRGESGGHTATISDEHSVYDEPGSVKRKNQFDNLVFMPDTSSLRSRPHTPSSTHGMRVGGSVSSFSMQQPVQYADLRQMSNPNVNIHHVRQISHQELRSNLFDSLERPSSTLSAPAYKPHSKEKSPFMKRILQPTGAKQKTYKHTYSPKTPHSAPTETRQPVVNRPRAQSSPRFRYPSTVSSDESHYTLPKLDSYEDMTPRRKMGISDDNIHEHCDAVQGTDATNMCDPESYLYPSPGLEESQIPSEPEHKITYLTAKDLVPNESEEEEEISPETEGTVLYFGAESHSVVRTPESSIETQTQSKPERITSITSPTDNEVMNINFPPSNRAFHPIGPNGTTDRDKYKPNTQPNRGNEAVFQTGDQNSKRPAAPVQAVVYQKNNSRNSISDVPDVIKHGAFEEDGVFII